jgi:hypothetical protein
VGEKREGIGKEERKGRRRRRNRTGTSTPSNFFPYFRYLPKLTLLVDSLPLPLPFEIFSLLFFFIPLLFLPSLSSLFFLSRYKFTNQKYIKNKRYPS